jgi:DNA-binding beta-propeller fold protein YncE
VAALDGPPSVLVHDLETGRVLAQLALGEHGAVEVLFSRDGQRVYASQMETGLVYELSAREHRLLRTLNARGKWSKVLALSPDGRRLYVSNWLGADVSELDLQSGKLVRKLATVETPRGLYPSADGRWLYVAGFERGELARIDLRTGESEVVFSSGGALRHLVADEARGLLFASDMARARIWVHELRTGRTRELARTGRNPNTIALSPDGSVLYVSCRGRNGPGGYLTAGKEPGEVLALDARTGERLESLVAGKQPTALAVSADGARLVFSDFRDDQLEVYQVPQPLAGGMAGPAEKSRSGPVGSRMEPGGRPWP